MRVLHFRTQNRAGNKMITAEEHKRCVGLAERVVQAAGMDPSESVILQENLASYLHEIPDFAAKLERMKNDELKVQIARGNLFWRDGPKEKFLSDAKSPYNDVKVLTRLDLASHSLWTSFGIGKYAPDLASKKVYLVGGFAQGRFGGNSDIDIFYGSNDITRYIWHVENLHLIPIFRMGVRRLRKNIERFNTALPVRISELDPNKGMLKSFYIGCLAERGITVEFTPGGAVKAKRTWIPERLREEWKDDLKF